MMSLVMRVAKMTTIIILLCYDLNTVILYGNQVFNILLIICGYTAISICVQVYLDLFFEAIMRYLPSLSFDKFWIYAPAIIICQYSAIQVYQHSLLLG